MPRPQVNISGVPFDIAVVRLEDNKVVLRLYNTDASFKYDIVIPEITENREITLPGDFAYSGQEANLKIGDTGTVSPNYPQPYIVDQATLDVTASPNQTSINAALNLLKGKVNEILAALRLAFILAPSNTIITAAPVRMSMYPLNPIVIIPAVVEMAMSPTFNKTITPSPAEMGLSAL